MNYYFHSCYFFKIKTNNRDGLSISEEIKGVSTMNLRTLKLFSYSKRVLCMVKFFLLGLSFESCGINLFEEINSSRKNNFITSPLSKKIIMSAFIKYEERSDFTKKATMTFLSINNKFLERKLLKKAIHLTAKQNLKRDFFKITTQVEDEKLSWQLDQDLKKKLLYYTYDDGIEKVIKTNLIYSSVLKEMSGETLFQVEREQKTRKNKAKRKHFRTRVKSSHSEEWLRSNEPTFDIRAQKFELDLGGLPKGTEASSKTLSLKTKKGSFFLTKLEKGLLMIRFSKFSPLEAFSIALSTL